MFCIVLWRKIWIWGFWKREDNFWRTLIIWWREMEWIYLAHCRHKCQGTVNVELKLHVIESAEFFIRDVTTSLSINRAVWISLGNLIRISAICIRPTLLCKLSHGGWDGLELQDAVGSALNTLENLAYKALEREFTWNIGRRWCDNIKIPGWIVRADVK
jgi:hypothetical protein